MFKIKYLTQYQYQSKILPFNILSSNQNFLKKINLFINNNNNNKLINQSYFNFSLNEKELRAIRPKGKKIFLKYENLDNIEFIKESLKKNYPNISNFLYEEKSKNCWEIHFECFKSFSLTGASPKLKLNYEGNVYLPSILGSLTGKENYEKAERKIENNYNEENKPEEKKEITKKKNKSRKKLEKEENIELKEIKEYNITIDNIRNINDESKTENEKDLEAKINILTDQLKSLSDQLLFAHKKLEEKVRKHIQKEKIEQNEKQLDSDFNKIDSKKPKEKTESQIEFIEKNLSKDSTNEINEFEELEKEENKFYEKERDLKSLNEIENPLKDYIINLKEFRAYDYINQNIDINLSEKGKNINKSIYKFNNEFKNFLLNQKLFNPINFCKTLNEYLIVSNEYLYTSEKIPKINDIYLRKKFFNLISISLKGINRNDNKTIYLPLDYSSKLKLKDIFEKKIEDFMILIANRSLFIFYQNERGDNNINKISRDLNYYKKKNLITNEILNVIRGEFIFSDNYKYFEEIENIFEINVYCNNNNSNSITNFEYSFTPIKYLYDPRN